MKGKKLLIVDDQAGIRLLLQEVFGEEGFETFLAPNGETALDIVANEQIDMILLDMKIPGMDGLEILRRIKAMDKQIKVIMMTAYSELEVINEMKNLGAMMYFKKPFDIDELRTEVLRHFHEQAQHLKKL